MPDPMLPHQESGFVTNWFLRSLLKKGAVSFLAMLASLQAAPHLGPILSTLGITIEALEGATRITIQHASFVAGLSALAFMALEGGRVLAAKHPGIRLPDALKRWL